MTSGNNIVPSQGSPLQTGNQFKSLESLYANWDIVEEDIVNYRDAARRGLDFMFSAIRKAPNNVIDSPVNKKVSVYQKNEEGDFVIVSVSGNNPNDIRVMEMTNEFYGDPEPDPMYFVNKVIEMADGSGMLRDKAEFADFGIVETAGMTYEEFTNSMGIKPTETPSESVVNRVEAKLQGTKTGRIFQKITSAIGRTAAGRSTSVQSGAGWFKGLKNALGGPKQKDTTGKLNDTQKAFMKHNLQESAFGKKAEMQKYDWEQKHQQQASNIGYKQEELLHKTGSQEKIATLKSSTDIKKETIKGLYGNQQTTMKTQADIQKTRIQAGAKKKIEGYKHNIFNEKESIAKAKGIGATFGKTPNAIQQDINRIHTAFGLKPGEGSKKMPSGVSTTEPIKQPAGNIATNRYNPYPNSPVVGSKPAQPLPSGASKQTLKQKTLSTGPAPGPIAKPGNPLQSPTQSQYNTFSSSDKDLYHRDQMKQSQYNDKLANKTNIPKPSSPGFSMKPKKF